MLALFEYDVTRQKQKAIFHSIDLFNELQALNCDDKTPNCCCFDLNDNEALCGRWVTSFGSGSFSTKWSWVGG
jgi:hypothetical protein